MQFNTLTQQVRRIARRSLPLALVGALYSANANAQILSKVISMAHNWLADFEAIVFILLVIGLLWAGASFVSGHIERGLLRAACVIIGAIIAGAAPVIITAVYSLATG